MIDIRKFLFGISETQNITKEKIIFRILYVIFAIFINYAGAGLAQLIIFPLFLDSIMTISVVAICGLIPGLVCALGSSALIVFISHSALFIFSICHLATAILAAIVFAFFDRRFKNQIINIYYFLWAGFWSAISNGIIGNIISGHIFASITGRPSVDIVVQGIFSAVPNLSFASNYGGLLENLGDKTLSAVISYLFYKLVVTLERKYHNHIK